MALEPIKSIAGRDKAPDPARTGHYIPTLDGWRCVAILIVMQAHSPLLRLGGISNFWVRVIGDRGVDLFFALSGILICTRLLREEKRFGSISLRSFYTRRIFRIQPAALTYLGVMALLMWMRSIPRDWAGIAGAGFMIRNYFPSKGIWETMHFWSLAAEEHFYIFLPAFLVLCRRYRLTVMSLLVVTFELWRFVVFSHRKLQGFGMILGFRTDVVLGGILLGCVFALALTRPDLHAFAQSWLVPWVALLYATLIFTVTRFHGTRLNHALLISVYPLLITATMLHPQALTSRVLEWAPLRFLGRISFSLYLWQQFFFNPLRLRPGPFLGNTLLCWCSVFACAIASYYLIETPLIGVGHRLAKRSDRRQALQTVMA